MQFYFQDNFMPKQTHNKTPILHRPNTPDIHIYRPIGEIINYVPVFRQHVSHSRRVGLQQSGLNRLQRYAELTYWVHCRLVDR